MAKILIVDDEKSVRITLREFMFEDSHEVETAENVDEAITHLQNSQFDVVITDIIMPKLSGVTLLKKIKEISPEVQVIMITGEPSVETAGEAVRAGAFDYLSKPISCDQIQNIVYKAAKIKNLSDDKRRLEKENLAYQKQLEEMVIKRTNQLVSTQQKFEMAVEGSLSGLWMRDFQTDEFWVSAQYAKLLQYSINEFSLDYDSWLNKIHPDDVENVVQMQNQHLSNNIPYEIEYRLRTKSGRYKWFFAKGVASRDHEGKPLKIAGSIQDINERKLKETEIKAKDERFRQLTDSLPQAVFEVDLEGKFNFLNRYGIELSGYSEEEIIAGKTTFDLITPEDRDRCIRGFKQSIETNKTVSDEYTFITQSCMRIPVKLFCKPILNDNVCIGVRGIIMDLTEQKESEKKIRQLSRSVEQSPVSVVITDTEGNIEYVNPRFTQITGYSAEEVIGKKPSILKTGHTPDTIYKELWDTITAGKEWRGEFYNKKKNGDLFWETASISSIKDSKGNITHFLAVKEEITKLKKLLDDLVVARDKAETADRLKSEFLAQMSHEIRTPINAIVSFSGLLKEELEESIPDDLKTGFRLIDKAGRRIIRTVDLLLNLAEIQAGSYECIPKELDLYGEVIGSIIQEFKPFAAEKGIELILKVNTEDSNITADSYTINQVFNNLLDNAIKFTQIGSVTIDVSRNEKDELLVQIIDTGIGISEKYLPNIFEPFTQEDQGYTRSFEGNGIGLSLVKKFCEMNNVEINVFSKKDIGSTFTLNFGNKQ